MRVSPLPRRAASENSGSSSEEEDEEAEDEEKKKEEDEEEDEEEDDDDDEPAAPTSSQAPPPPPAGAGFYETQTIAGKKVSIRKVSAKLAKKSKNFTDLVRRFRRSKKTPRRLRSGSAWASRAGGLPLSR